MNRGMYPLYIGLLVFIICLCAYDSWTPPPIESQEPLTPPPTLPPPEEEPEDPRNDPEWVDDTDIESPSSESPNLFLMLIGLLFVAILYGIIFVYRKFFSKKKAYELYDGWKRYDGFPITKKVYNGLQMSDKKRVSRRGYVKYAASGVTVIAGAAAGVYYMTRSTEISSATEEATQVQQIVEESKWLSSDGNVISYMDANEYVGQRKTVEGTIVRTYKSSAAIFLNFHDPYQGYFYIVIFKDDWGNFSFNPEDYYRGKEVRVTGKIQEYQGSPEIIAENPSQIEVANKGFDYP